MNWSQAFRRLQELERARAPRARFESGTSAASLRRVRAGSICIASGKGGTGKTVVSAALSTLLAERGRTLLIDADLGVGNAHILQDLHPERTLIDVVQGRVEMAEARTHCREGLDLLAGGSGVSSVASLAPVELRLLANGLARLDDQYSFQIIDSAAGISEQTLALAAASDIVLVVTTPDVTAMTDAYALLKVLFSKGYDGIPLVVVNRVTEPGEGERVATRIAQVSERFLRRELRWIGSLPEDRAVVRSVAARQPVSLCEPASEVAHALAQLALSLCDELERAPRRGLGTELLARLDAARA